MQSQPVEKTVAYLEAWRPDPQAQTHTAAELASELRESASAKPEPFSAGAAAFVSVRPLFIRLSVCTENPIRID
jgi:hypothetical protein